MHYGSATKSSFHLVQVIYIVTRKKKVIYIAPALPITMLATYSESNYQIRQYDLEQPWYVLFKSSRTAPARRIIQVRRISSTYLNTMCQRKIIWFMDALKLEEFNQLCFQFRCCKMEALNCHGWLSFPGLGHGVSLPRRMVRS